jgi:hypothetical protein
MEIVALLLAALLTVALVLFVARPFLLPSQESDRLEQPSAAELERTRLLEERDRALAALKELEFDHRTGKVSDADYGELVGPLRRRAAEALRAIERREGAERERPKADVRA